MLRLILALLAPTVLVAVALLGLEDVRAAFLAYAFGGCVAGPWLLLGAKPLRRGFGLPLVSPQAPRAPALRRGLVQAVILGGGLFAGYALGQRWLADPAALQSRLASMQWNPSHVPIYGVLFVLLIPLLEEWWWRGQALPRCIQRFGRTGGVAVAAASFAAYHVIVLSRMYDPASVVVRVLTITAAGVYWCLVAWRRRAWIETYLGHLGASVAVVLAFTLIFLG